MSRKMSDFNNQIIKRLRDYIPDEQLFRITNSKKMIFLDEEQYSFLEKAKISQTDTMGGAISLINYSDEKYLCINDTVYRSNVFKEEEIDKKTIVCIGLLLLVENRIQIVRDLEPIRIIDEILGFKDDKKFDPDVILDFYDHYSVIKVTDDEAGDYEFIEDLDRVYCRLIDENIDEKYKSLIVRYEEILNLKSSRAIVKLMWMIHSVKDDAILFLQFYRCLEYLFIIKYAISFSNKYHLDLLSLTNMILNENVRFSENQTIRALIDEYGDLVEIENYYNFIKDLKGKHEDSDPDTVIESEKMIKEVADYIYDIRCKTAHYKYKHSDIDKRALIESMEHLLGLMYSIFEKMDSYIIQINETEKIWTELEFRYNWTSD